MTSVDDPDMMNPHAHKRKDWIMAAKPGHELSGKTSDRIRSGEIDTQATAGVTHDNREESAPITLDTGGYSLGHGAGRTSDNGR